jgi:hypothetical protein
MISHSEDRVLDIANGSWSPVALRRVNMEHTDSIGHRRVDGQNAAKMDGAAIHSLLKSLRH